MTYQKKKKIFRVITLHNINCLRRKVSGEYFSEITYKKNSKYSVESKERWKSLDSRVCLELPYNEFRLVSDCITDGKVAVHSD